MKSDDVRKLLEDKIKELESNPIKAIKEIILVYWNIYDDELPEIRNMIVSDLRMGFETSIRRGLRAVDSVLSANEHDAVIFDMVTSLGCVELEELDIPHARAWLREKADWIAGILAHEGPRL